MAMNIRFEHYTWGMLQTSNGQAVAGSERVVAYTPDVTDNMRLRVRKFAKAGLRSSVLGDNDAYAFFPLGSGDYVVSHYQVSPLSEPVSRGKPVFAQHVWINEDQLEQIGWNLVSVFHLFKPIGVYSEVEEQAHLELDLFQASRLHDKWSDAIRSNMLLVQSVLVQLLSTNEQIGITSGPSHQDERLYWICGLIQCLPRDLRRALSFCTLADPIASSARVIFPDRGSSSVVPVDWGSPSERSGPGSIYAAWIAEISSDTPDIFRDKVDSLRLPYGEGKPESLAAQLDLAVEFAHWMKTPIEPMQAGKSGLDQLSADICKYRPILTADEVVEWLGMLLSRAIILSECDSAGQNAIQHISLLEGVETEQKIVERVLAEVFKREHIDQLVQFIVRLDALSRRNSYQPLRQFAENVVLACLNRDLDQGLTLWKELMHKDWGRSAQWAARVLCTLGSVETGLFPELAEAIMGLANVKVFAELGELLERSGEGPKREYRQTHAFLRRFMQREVSTISDSVLRELADSYGEMKKPRWFVVSTKLALGKLPIETLSSSAFVPRCVEFLKLHATQPIGAELCSVLARDPKLVYATSQDCLGDLLDASIEYGTGQLATLCFVAMIKHLLPNGNLDETLFAPYQSKLLSMNVVEVLDQVAREYPRVEEMSLSDLRHWVEFLKELLKAEGTDSGSRSRLCTRYVKALRVVTRKQRCRDVEDLAVAFPLLRDRTLPNLSDALLRLIHEIVWFGDVDAWIRLSRRVNETQCKQLITEYRKCVNTACQSVLVDESNFTYYLDVQTQLRNSSLAWESGILVCMLLQFPIREALRKLAVPLASTILDMQTEGVSLAELGAWLDPVIWLAEGPSRDVICRTLVAQDRDLAQEALSACLALSRRADRTEPKYPGDTERLLPERRGANFVYLVARTLAREMSR